MLFFKLIVLVYCFRLLYEFTLAYGYHMYMLLNVYRKIFGTSSYGEDARACQYLTIYIQYFFIIYPLNSITTTN